MKYGDTLGQRSIPEWGTYNVDYNEIKHLIKLRTSEGQGQAISIPGNGGQSKVLQEFEEELYDELYEQHQRIDLFVQSKSGEISRRLNHLHKQILQLGRRALLVGHTHISVKRLEKFSRAEEDVLKAGEDIQALSRFVGAQRLAFQKLLKKYKKWTSSSTLGKRFQQEVLGQPSSFSKRDLGPLLSQWTDTLAAVRAPFDAGLTWKEPAASQGRPRVHSGTGASHQDQCDDDNAAGTFGESATASSSLNAVFKSGADVDVDTALAVCPFGDNGGMATYWIHPDNLVEIHILLLQYTRLWLGNKSARSSSNSASSRSSRRGSVHGSTNGCIPGPDDGVDTIVCDDPHILRNHKGIAKVVEADSLPGKVPEQAAASIRYSLIGEAVVVVGTSSEGSTTSGWRRGTMRKAKIKRKAIRQLFEVNQSSPTQRQSSQMQDCESIRQWLYTNQEVQPLLHIRSTRTRFLGLGNDENQGIYATLDQNTIMERTSLEQLDSVEGTSDFNDAESVKFPYAVLQVRWEGRSAINLIQVLDESHLTERVRGFSFETHAFATLYKSQGTPNPFWMDKVDQDIRKIPATVPTLRQSATNSQTSPASGSTHPASISATSTADGPTSSGFSIPVPESPATTVPDQLETPPLKAFRKKRRSREEHPLRRQLGESETPYQRYWNEFDDGDEAAETEPYTIFVDVDSSSSFPGATAISKIATVIANTAQHSSEKVRSWLGLSSKHMNGNEDYFAQRPLIEDSEIDDDESSTENLLAQQRARRYSTFPDSRRRELDHAFGDRESLLFHCCIGSFLASFALLIVAGVLEATRRRKDVVAADLGVTVGLISSLVFAIIGIGMMIGSKDDVGWMHRTGVLLVFVIICVGNGVLLAVLGGG